MFSRITGRLLLIVFILATAGAFMSRPAQADILTNRYLVEGTNSPSAVTTHSFTFDVPDTTNLGSIKMQYCDNSPWFTRPCVAPAGLDVSEGVLTSQSGNTGFSIDPAGTNANTIILTRTAAAGTVTSNNYVFSNITNPSTPGQTVYVRISTHTATDGSGTNNDTGAVAFAVQSIFNVNAFVPPFLQMCVGVTVAPDCSTVVGDSVDLGILSNTAANKGTSQYSVATNDINGYVVYALGTTMTSGNNVIQALSAPSGSFPGTAQFGINLRANLIPTVGQDPVLVGINSTGLPTTNYNIPNRFVYNDGDSISASTLPSNYNRMTVSYLVNVPKSQPPGVYSTTLTYVATVQF